MTGFVYAISNGRGAGPLDWFEAALIRERDGG
jgi:hypothetical protein